VKAAPRYAALFAAVATLVLPALAFGAEGSDTKQFETALQGGLLPAYALAFASGLGLTLTPCVYPMIAITVSVFGAGSQAKSRARGAMLSAFFILGMALLFTVLGVVSALTGSVFGTYLSNPWVVGGVALLFVVLSSSMFGAFEMALPASLNNRLAQVGGIGFGGAFVLGLVSALVAAPCTGPFTTGLLLWISTTKNVLVGASVMFTMALGLGLPFFVVGTFAVNLPKGGAWMVGIKWVFGVALATFALYFLRNGFPAVGKLVGGAPAYLYGSLMLLVVGFALAGVHVAGERRKSPIAHLSKPFKLASIVPAVAGAFMLVSWIQVPKGELKWIESETEAQTLASSEKRPMIVDFGAEWCAACKELAVHTFADEKVRSEAGRFVAVKVDATDEDDKQIAALKDKYKVVGLPTVVVLDSEGREKVRFNEFVPPERFLEAIKAVN
jgi:thiol:disulfide interchange protein DsbD